MARRQHCVVHAIVRGEVTDPIASPVGIANVYEHANATLEQRLDVVLSAEAPEIPGSFKPLIDTPADYREVAVGAVDAKRGLCRRIVEVRRGVSAGQGVDEIWSNGVGVGAKTAYFAIG